MQRSSEINNELPILMDFENTQHSSCSSSPEIISAAAGSSFRKRNDGRKRFKVTRHPTYRGVRRRNGDKWVCEVREPNTQSRIWLGTFLTPEMAAAAHDAAALALRGKDAQFNFPESAHLLPRAASSSHEDIRRAALQAAACFEPPASSFDAGNPSLSSSLVIENGGGNGVGFDTFGSENVSNNNDDNSGVEFVDEEAIYNMPALLDSMAEGMLLTPMAMEKGFNWGHQVDDEIEITLWGD